MTDSMSDARRPAVAELHAMLRLALPVVLVQVGYTAMGVVDAIMVGHSPVNSASALASVALGHLYFFNASIFAMGTLMALDPLVAQAVGAGDTAAVSHAVQRGAVLALLLTVLTAALLLPAEPLFRLAGQPPSIVPDAARYARVSIWGVLPLLVFTVMRQSLQAVGRIAPIVLTVVVANLANAGLNWVLVFGHLGSPPLGPVGSAWATVASRWLMAALLLALGWREMRPMMRPLHPDALRAAPLRRMFQLGAPIGIMQTLETGAFGTIGLLMGRLGALEMAGHQIAITLASLTFMVPLGVGAAAAVRVGYAVGRGDAAGARRSAKAGLICGAAFMTLTALLFLAAPRALARVYTEDARLIALAATLIPIAGVFQVFDGIQAVAAGVLRGAGDTRVPLAVNLLGFWLLGIPLSAMLGLHTRAGAAGLWWGLVGALAAVALFLTLRIRKELGRDLRRVDA